MARWATVPVPVPSPSAHDSHHAAQVSRWKATCIRCNFFGRAQRIVCASASHTNADRTQTSAPLCSLSVCLSVSDPSASLVWRCPRLRDDVPSHPRPHCERTQIMHSCSRVARTSTVRRGHRDDAGVVAAPRTASLAGSWHCTHALCCACHCRVCVRAATIGLTDEQKEFQNVALDFAKVSDALQRCTCSDCAAGIMAAPQARAIAGLGEARRDGTVRRQ